MVVPIYKKGWSEGVLQIQWVTLIIHSESVCPLVVLWSSNIVGFILVVEQWLVIPSGIFEGALKFTLPD